MCYDPNKNNRARIQKKSYLIADAADDQDKWIAVIALMLVTCVLFLILYHKCHKANEEGLEQYEDVNKTQSNEPETEMTQSSHNGI